jgi:signal transduction histidine kinase
MAKPVIQRKATWLVCLLLLWLPVLSLAQGRDIAPKPSRVKGLVQEAVVLAREQGLEAAVRQVNAPAGPFCQGALRIFILDTAEGLLLADPLRPESVGRRVWDLVDFKGKAYYRAMAEAAKETGAGWSDHFVIPPGGKYADIEAVYVEQLPGTRILIGSGLFDMDAPTAAAQSRD